MNYLSSNLKVEDELWSVPQLAKKLPTTIVIVGSGIALSWLIGDDPTIINSLFRTVLWFITAYYGARHFLWQPSPSSWFIAFYLMSFATWPFLFLLGHLFFRETTSYIVIAGLDPTLGFIVDRGYYVFFSIVLIAMNASNVFTTYRNLPIPVSGGAETYDLVPLLALTLFGACAGIISQFLPGALAQILNIFVNLSAAGIGILCIYGSKQGPAKNKYMKFALPAILTFTVGFLGFAATGFKGKFYIATLHLGWLCSFCDPRLRKPLIFGLLLLAGSFVFFLPAFHAMKAAAFEGNSMRQNLAIFVNALFKEQDAKFESGKVGGINLEQTWLYMSMRSCVATMTHIYFNRYSENPRSYESVWVSLRASIPRVFDANKISTNDYYNSIAIESGIGDPNDKKTSRKPTFVDESIIIWGWKGFLIGGLVFAAYLTFIEWTLIRIAPDLMSLFVLRFALMELGAFPYVGVVIGGISYLLIATALLYRIYVKMVIPQTQLG